MTSVARLSIDRAFTMRGFGVVVTGTLVSGAVAVGDTLTVLPNGHSVRVRGLQAYGQSVEQVTAPERAAINLAGLDLADVRRGMTLTSTASLPVTTRVDARIDLLKSAAAAEIAHGTRIRVHHGAGEWFARVSIAATCAGADRVDGREDGRRRRRDRLPGTPRMSACALNSLWPSRGTIGSCCARRRRR